MAIKTVTNANLAEFVEERTAKGSKIATGEEQVAAADAAKATEPQTEGTATPGNPVIKPGVAETLNTAPDPGNATPSAKASANPVQPRIDELIRQKKEAEEFAEDEYAQRLRAEARVGELEAELKKTQPKAETPKPEELKRPTPKDFETQEAYDAAMEAYDQARDERVRAQARAEGEANAAQREQARVMNQRIEAAKELLPDYVEVLQAAAKRTTEVPAHIKAAFLEDENGVYIAYELAKHAALEKRIFSLSPAKALIELGKIDLSKYVKSPAIVVDSTTQAKPTLETTRAPAPLTTVRTNGTGDVTPDLSKPMPFKDYMKHRLPQIRAARQRH